MQAQTIIEDVRQWVRRKQAVCSCEDLVEVAREAGDRGIAGRSLLFGAFVLVAPSQ